jgi:hypothetical protein
MAREEGIQTVRVELEAGIVAQYGIKERIGIDLARYPTPAVKPAQFVDLLGNG